MSHILTVSNSRVRSNDESSLKFDFFAQMSDSKPHGSNSEPRGPLVLL